jgi:L-alanine-DL-glutamate epimerase-like enolase superfamily enzyme
VTERGTKINRVELASCSLPLESPIYLGTVPITTRDYICMRLVTESGVEGFAIGYKSGSQLFESLEVLAPRLVGHDALMRQAFNLESELSRIPARASYVRALSIIDVALWDIAAKVAGLPLYLMLGGLRREVRAVPIVGFSHMSRPLAEIESEIDRHCEAGETLIKVMIKGTDSIANSGYIQALTSRMDEQASLAVDTHWSWRTISEALDTCRRIDDCGLAFIEDPFTPQQWRLVGELRSKLRTPIAVGEDVLDPYGFADLVQNVDILRVDATGSGGITAALNALALASANGRKALPHVFPYIHAQIACAHQAVMAVEYIPEHTGTDPVRKLLRSFPAIRNGSFQLTDEPGAGCDLQWAEVGAHASATRTFD